MKKREVIIEAMELSLNDFKQEIGKYETRLLNKRSVSVDKRSLKIINSLVLITNEWIKANEKLNHLYETNVDSNGEYDSCNKKLNEVARDIEKLGYEKANYLGYLAAVSEPVISNDKKRAYLEQYVDEKVLYFADANLCYDLLSLASDYIVASCAVYFCMPDEGVEDSTDGINDFVDHLKLTLIGLDEKTDVNITSWYDVIVHIRSDKSILFLKEMLSLNVHASSLKKIKAAIDENRVLKLNDLVEGYFYDIVKRISKRFPEFKDDTSIFVNIIKEDILEVILGQLFTILDIDSF